MKTLAAILVEQNQPLILDEIEVPKLGYGQVLVKLRTSRICGSQLGEISGIKGPDRWLPHLLGHEGSGQVLEVGTGVKIVSKGDKVCLHWRPGIGIESPPPRYNWNGQTVNAGYVTTFNHIAVISENRLTPVPDRTDDNVISLLADTLTTGFGIISNDAKVRIGESVVVIGCGGIGLGVLLAAKLAGAYPIIGIDIYDHKLEKAREFGATHTFNSSDNDFLEPARELLKGNADVVIDGTGIPSVIEQAYHLTSGKGRTILFGVMHHSDKLSINTLPLHFGKILTGSEGGASQPSKDIPRYLRMIDAERFDPKPMISHSGSLHDVNTLIDKMRSGEVIHAIMRYE